MKSWAEVWRRRVPSRNLGRFGAYQQGHSRFRRETGKYGGSMRVAAFSKQDFSKTLAAAALVALFGVAASPLLAEPADRADWPQFRGLNADGRSEAKGLLREWPAEGPKQLWRQRIGDGYSSVVAVGKRIFVATANKETEYAVSLDADTGKELWRQALGPIFIQEEFGSGTRSSATWDGELVYFISGKGQLFALKSADGAVAWKSDLLAAFGAGQPRFGYAASAVVAGDLLIVDAGGSPGKGIVAFDKKTGEVTWSALDSKTAHYASPLLVEIGGLRQLIIARREDPEILSLGLDGKTLWTYKGFPQGLAGGVLVAPDKIFFSSANDGTGFLLRVKTDGGKQVVEEVWRNAVLKSHFHSAVAADGLLFGFDNATLKCVDAETGAQKWAARGFGKGSVIEADGRLYILSDDGRMALAEKTGEAFRQIGSFQALTGKTWTAPTVAAGRLYLRDFDEIVAYDIQAK
jgi:outer membrane protein assembly factor BamB